MEHSPQASVYPTYVYLHILTSPQRGGAGNLAKSPRVGPQSEGRRSEDFIPETALRDHQDNFHTGRGGEGNVHKEKYGGHSHSPERKSLGDKVKAVFKHDKKPEHPSPLANEQTVLKD